MLNTPHVIACADICLKNSCGIHGCMVFVTPGITMDVQRNDSSDALVCNTCKSQIQVSRDYYCSKCEFCLCKRCKGLHSSTHKLIKVKEKYISEPTKKTRLENRYVDEPQGTQESVTYSYAYEHFSTKRFLKGQSSSSESGQNCGDAEQDDYIEIVERPDVPDPAEAKGQGGATSFVNLFEPTIVMNCNNMVFSTEFCVQMYKNMHKTNKEVVVLTAI